MEFNDFRSKYLGKSNIGNTNENKGECVGLIQVYIQEVLNFPHIWGNAKDIFANADSSHYEKIKNDPILYPEKGDIIVWDGRVGGGFGHIALVVSSDKNTDSFTVLEQNNPIDYPVREFTYTKWGYVTGWLHPIKQSLGETIGESPCKEIQDKYDSLDKKYKKDIKSKNEEIESLKISVSSLDEEMDQTTNNYNDLYTKYNNTLNELTELQKTLNYPKLNTVAWRFVRAFIGGFISSLAITLPTINSFNKAIIVSLITGALAGGIQALSKTLREYFGDENYQSILHKLPL